MRISIYENVPNDAKAIRTAVFINEQGFQNEFDEMKLHILYVMVKIMYLLQPVGCFGIRA